MKNSKNVDFVNFKQKNKKKISKKTLLNLIKSNNHIINSLKPSYKYSYPKNLILKSNNLIKTFSSKNFFNVLIVRPHFGCSTKKIYSKVKKFTKPIFHSASNNIFKTYYLKNFFLVIFLFIAFVI